MYRGETRARACGLVAGGNLAAIPPEKDPFRRPDCGDVDAAGEDADDVDDTSTLPVAKLGRGGNMRNVRNEWKRGACEREKGAPALEGLEEALGLGEGAVGEEERFEEDEIALGREEVLEQRLEGCGLDHLRVAARGLWIVGHSRPCSTQAAESFLKERKRRRKKERREGGGTRGDILDLVLGRVALKQSLLRRIACVVSSVGTEKKKKEI